MRAQFASDTRVFFYGISIEINERRDYFYLAYMTAQAHTQGLTLKKYPTQIASRREEADPAA